MTAFDKAWDVVKEDECEGDCNGCEYHPDKCNCRGCTDGGSKGDWCWRAGRPVDEEGNIEFNKAWGVVKEFIGPREKIEEGKRMVQGNKVFYGQRKWDDVVVPDMLGYIDEEGNERDFSLHTNQGGYKLLGTYPDANIRYRSDQKFPPGERPPPYTWGRKNAMPYPASVRDRYAKRKMREHQEKIRREMIEARDRNLEKLRRKRENSD